MTVLISELEVEYCQWSPANLINYKNKSSRKEAVSMKEAFLSIFVAPISNCNIVRNHITRWRRLADPWNVHLVLPNRNVEHLVQRWHGVGFIQGETKSEMRIICTTQNICSTRKISAKELEKMLKFSNTTEILQMRKVCVKITETFLPKTKFKILETQQK